MTDEQFKQLMKKLEDIERQMQAGTWFPQPTNPMRQTPYRSEDYLPARWPHYGATN